LTVTDQRLPVVLLMGPTASGKTAVALELVDRFPCDIISVDSVLVYRYLNIGSAKPDPAELRRAPHRLIDIRDPHEGYSVAEFRRDALQQIAEVHRRGRLPLLVGGTMMYYRVLQQGLSQMPDGDPHLRQRLDRLAERDGWPALHRQLADCDPQAAARIHPNDAQRIQRALEVYQLTGKPISHWQAQVQPDAFPFRVCKLALIPEDRQHLRQVIAERFTQMLDKGFEREVDDLRERFRLTEVHQSMRSVGYRQMLAYLQGRLDYPQMIEQAVTATRQLAKRQLTWLRQEPDLLTAGRPEGAVARFAESLQSLLRVASRRV
jgi:tRNA dimethylallyltransferase